MGWFDSFCEGVSCVVSEFTDPYTGSLHPSNVFDTIGSGLGKVVEVVEENPLMAAATVGGVLLAGPAGGVVSSVLGSMGSAVAGSGAVGILGGSAASTLGGAATTAATGTLASQVLKTAIAVAPQAGKLITAEQVMSAAVSALVQMQVEQRRREERAEALRQRAAEAEARRRTAEAAARKLEAEARALDRVSQAQLLQAQADARRAHHEAELAQAALRRELEEQQRQLKEQLDALG